MPTLFSGINVALQALLSHQQAIQVTEHNVANANTAGYRRQEAVLAAGIPYPMPLLAGSSLVGQMGTGVVVDNIRRFNLEFFDGRYRREIAESKRWELESSILKQVEVTLAETGGDGLVSRLDAFWGGWQALSSDPANMALRADLKERAFALVDALNWRANVLLALRNDQDLAIEERVEEINQLASQVARLNVEITHIQSSGANPNDLLDKRDLLLDRLAEIAGATASQQENGEVLVSIGQHALVIGAKTFTLTTTPDPANSNLAQIIWSEDGMSFSAPRGELTGLLDARDRVIPAQMESLNQVAFTLAQRINQLHRAGYGLNNATNLDFFEPFTTTDYALEIKVSANLDNLNNIAASTTTDAPGNGNQAGVIAAVRDELILAGGTVSINQYYVGKIGELGLEIDGAKTRARDRGLVAKSLETMRESQTGVSLDEEAANLIKSQRAYQAAARMMTAMDEMLDRVINGMGIVGR